MHKTIIYVAGRSGGHILPCISLAQEYKEESCSSKTIFITINTNLDTTIIAQHPWIDQHYAYNLNNFPGSKLWRYPSFCLQFLFCFLKSLRLIYKAKPTTIISTGGYIAIPICLAAKIMRVPIELYELNVIPGKAIKLLAPLATRVCICFSIKPVLKKTKLSREQALENLNLTTSKKTIFVLGGSQGSQFLNILMAKFAPYADNVQIIHQTGNNTSIDWNALYAQHNIPAYVFDFASNIENYYAAADVVICRSGAGTLFELVQLEKKAITIPLQTASTHHQKYNALALAEQYPELITLLEQNAIENDPTVFVQKVQALM